jgi:hypothetical protein
MDFAAESVAAVVGERTRGTSASHLTAEGEASRPWWGHISWALGAGLLGFVTSYVFATVTGLSRPVFLLVYLILASPVLYGYARWSGSHPLRLLKKHWYWGLVGAVVIGAFVVRSVLAQDASPRPDGLALAGNLLWLGLVYGLLDALMLSVLPVIATWRALKSLGWTRTWPGRVGVIVLALAVSLVVTLAYHLGFAEYQGSGIGSPLIGNGIMSLGYIATGNPLTAVLAHMAMHVTAVLHGFTSAVQLPPHF